MSIVLMDAPDDGYCENFGWVEATVPEADAGQMLAGLCMDEDGNTGEHVYPRVAPTRVWLRSDGHDEAERWTKCDPTDDGAREFYEFDVTI
jgi:hypothetical protein